MTGETGWRVRPAAAVIAAVLLMIAGAAAAALLMRGRPGANDAAGIADASRATRPSPLPPARPAPTAGSGLSDSGTGAPLPDVIVPLTTDMIARAGIVIEKVTSSPGTSEIRLPGVVEPNAYKQVVVTSFVPGRVTEVSAQLGDHVRRGQSLVQIYSPELAEAQTRYVSARAMLEAHDRELQRTEKLVEIGAASRQELERTHAEHTAQRADLETARSRLLLLGVPATALDDVAAGKDVSPTARVQAPIDGVVTERLANVGLNVDPSTKLLTVVDLGTVWIVADVYEKDFSRVRTGTPATITTAAYPDRPFEGRVSYIDPQLTAATRTAKVRVEVANPRGDLRLGMYATVLVRTTETVVMTSIPRSAVQQVGDREVVYLESKDPGKFIEREVHVDRSSGDRVSVTSGLQPGDAVVTKGSFFVRAERERLGLRQLPASSGSPSRANLPVTNPEIQTARVTVGQSFEPSSLTLRAGVPARIAFVRTTDKTCAKEVVFPSLNIRRELPLNEPVVIEFTPQKGEVGFTCGMNMLQGTLVAK